MKNVINNELKERLKKVVKMINYIEEKYFIGYLENIFDCRKSFYKKAKIYKKDNMLYLKSYNTIVCAIDLQNKKYYIEDYFSDTTSRHVNDFLLQNNCIKRKIGKQEILKIKEEWQNMEE